MRRYSALLLSIRRDDNLVLFEGKYDIFTVWLNMLNNKDTNIKVTAEIEKNRQLSYLDILITRRQDMFST